MSLMMAGDGPVRPTNAADQWRAELAAWRIPDEILARAPESPYGFPVALFTAPDEASDTPSRAVALAALPPRGTVIDVGCGAGRAAFALVPPAGRVVGVDESPDMLRAFAQGAADRGVEHVEVQGTWPDVAPAAGTGDVALAHHVAYNVPELAAFAHALSAVGHRVVLELTTEHPWVRTNWLWERFHGIDRPSGPTADLAVQVLRESGVDVHVLTWEQQPRSPDRASTVALVRRRLCLPTSAEPEIDAALPADFGLIARHVCTIWWDA